MSEDDDAQRPPRLTEGARVAVIAPSSGLLEPSAMDRGLRAMTRMGLEPVLASGVREIRGYLAGDDARRAEDLRWALSDESIDAVWCVRGGYGAQRTVAALGSEPLRELAQTPARPFIGFSDITVLHALIASQLGWVTFYGPAVTSLGHASDYTLASVRDALFTGEPYTVGPNPDDDWVTTVVPGQARGPLAGGCLTLLAALAGTPLQVDFAGRICVIEDVGEPVHALDRYLCQLLAAGCLDGCVGIAIGDMTDVQRDGPNTLGVEQVIFDLLAPLGIPCCFYLPLGHGTHQATLPLGALAELDADRGVLQVLEAPVR